MHTRHLRGALFLGCAASLLLGATLEPTRPTLDGKWHSESIESIPAGDGRTHYLLRGFEFSGTSWHVQFTIFEDRALTTLLISGENSGDYVIAPLVDADLGGSPVEFRFHERTLTPFVRSVADMLTSAGCGTHKWRIGETQSVFDTGCMPFHIFPRKQCDREFNRVKLQAHRLFLGAAAADGFMCSSARRPQAVSADALVRTRPMSQLNEFLIE
jgi:hypothetical protein